MITAIEHLELIEKQINMQFKSNTELYMLWYKGKRHSLHFKSKINVLRFLAMRGYEPERCSVHTVQVKNYL